MRRACVLAQAFALLSLDASVASAMEPDVSGFVELRGGYQLGVAGSPWDMVARVRPTLELPLHPRWTMTTTMETWARVGPSVTDRLGALALESELPWLISLLDNCTSAGEHGSPWGSLSDHLLLDRFFVDAYLPGVDLRLGRQALQWGSGFLVNPTDPMPEVLFAEPWRPRRGVNAARLTLPIEDVHQVQAVLSVSDRFDAWRVATRGTLNVAGMDLSVIGAYRSDADNGLVGLDIRGAYEVGFWFEGALHIDSGGARVREEFVLGLDYVAPVLQRMMFVAQYYRSGRGGGGLGGLVGQSLERGLADCGPLTDLLPRSGVRDPFAPVFGGRDYLLLSVSAGIVEELDVTLLGFQNLGDGTGLFVSTVNTRPTGWLTLAWTAQVPYRAWGSGGEFRPSAEMVSSGLESSVPLDLGALDATRLLPVASFSVWGRASF